MKDIVRAINSAPHGDGFVVIADDMTTTDGTGTGLSPTADATVSAKYAHPSISGVATITIGAARKIFNLPSLGTGAAALTAISATELSVNTHYKGSVSTALAMSIPSAAAGRAGDWITVTYTAAINNGAAHTYTTSTDTAYWGAVGDCMDTVTTDVSYGVQAAQPRNTGSCATSLLNKPFICWAEGLGFGGGWSCDIYVTYAYTKVL